MKAIKYFFQTCRYVLKGERYPIIELFDYWVWKWDKNGNVKYYHFRTFLRFINNGKKAKR